MYFNNALAFNFAIKYSESFFRSEIKRTLLWRLQALNKLSLNVIRTLSLLPPHNFEKCDSRSLLLHDFEKLSQLSLMFVFKS